MFVQILREDCDLSRGTSTSAPLHKDILSTCKNLFQQTTWIVIIRKIIYAVLLSGTYSQTSSTSKQFYINNISSEIM